MSRRASKNQKIYKVTVTKTFEYPFSVINEDDFNSDLFEKSIEDFKENISTFKKKDFEINIQFSFPGLKYLKRDKPDIYLDKRTNTSTFEYYINHFVVNDVEEEFGKLDPQLNPDIYLAEEINIYADDEDWDGEGEREVIDTQVEYQLKEDVSEFYIERQQHYLTILRKKGI